MIFHRRVNALINAKAKIPDNNPRGLTSTYACKMPGQVKSATLHVDISHTAIGQLSVNLTSPSGVTVNVHNRQGGRRDNLKETFTGPTLRALNGQESEGTWTLQVIDHQGREVGHLNSWRLELDLERKAENLNRFGMDIGKIIPPNDAGGLSAMITVPRSAVADMQSGNLRVHLELDREFITDLQITLTAPSGKKLNLNSCMGWTKFGKKTWTLPGMRIEGLAGETLHGTWGFNIAGPGLLQTGRIESFTLELAPSSDLAVSQIGVRAAEHLIRSGISTQDRLNAAVPIEIAATLALRGHDDSIAVANRIERDRQAA